MHLLLRKLERRLMVVSKQFLDILYLCIVFYNCSFKVIFFCSCFIGLSYYFLSPEKFHFFLEISSIFEKRDLKIQPEHSRLCSDTSQLSKSCCSTFPRIFAISKYEQIDLFVPDIAGKSCKKI